MSDKIDSRPPHGISRRDALKLGGVGLLSGLAVASNIEPARSIIYGPRIDDIPREIPPVLQDKEIPTTNEYLTRPSKIVEDALNIYEEWRKSSSDLPQVKYVPPVNYLSLDVLDDRLKDFLANGPDYSKDNEGLAWQLEDIIYRNDQPYSNFLIFGASDISSPGELIAIDPGSGFVREIKKNLKQKHGEDYEPYKDAENKSFSDEALEIIKNTFSKRFLRAKQYIQETGNGSRVSSSILFAYFLHINKGDIVSSLNDTTIFFKTAARNDIKTLEYNPTREGAELIDDLFYDEFSPEIPFAWLLENVPPTDEILNILPATENEEKFGQYYKYKDFMPINRAGGFYHAWNIIAWSACMAPLLNEQLTKSFYIHGQLGGHDMRPPNGRVKVQADILASQDSERLKNIWSRYS